MPYSRRALPFASLAALVAGSAASDVAASPGVIAPIQLPHPVTISPMPARMIACQSQVLTANVASHWTVTPGGGTIAPGGFPTAVTYTAPGVTPPGAQVTITAAPEDTTNYLARSMPIAVAAAFPGAQTQLGVTPRDFLIVARYVRERRLDGLLALRDEAGRDAHPAVRRAAGPGSSVGFGAGIALPLAPGANINSYSIVAASASELYVAFATGLTSGVGGAMWLTRSLNGGGSWDAPVRVYQQGTTQYTTLRPIVRYVPGAGGGVARILIAANGVPMGNGEMVIRSGPRSCSARRTGRWRSRSPTVAWPFRTARCASRSRRPRRAPPPWSAARRGSATRTTPSTMRAETPGSYGAD